MMQTAPFWVAMLTGSNGVKGILPRLQLPRKPGGTIRFFTINALDGSGEGSQAESKSDSLVS